tara:strand:- start:260 stop:373 length:114 start_codon:yes stop_codon:yes gene_type:complete
MFLIVFNICAFSVGVRGWSCASKGVDKKIRESPRVKK